MIEPIEYTTAEYPAVTYRREPIPVAVLDGVPWWSTAHIQSLVVDRYNPGACEAFTVEHVGAHRFPFDSEDELSHVITSEAALWLLNAHPLRKAYRWAAGWLRKRDEALRTAGDYEFPLLKLNADGTFPPQPDWGSEHRRQAWQRSIELHAPNDWQRRLDAQRAEAKRLEDLRFAEVMRKARRFHPQPQQPILQG